MKPEIPESLRDLMKMSIEQAKRAFGLQSQHARKQMEAFVHQLEEMRDLAAQIIQEANPVKAEATPAATPKPSPAPSHSSGTSSYQSPSGYTPSRGY
jgi:type II secretory pathway component PulM